MLYVAKLLDIMLLGEVNDGDGVSFIASPSAVGDAEGVLALDDEGLPDLSSLTAVPGVS